MVNTHLCLLVVNDAPVGGASCGGWSVPPPSGWFRSGASV